MNGELLMIYYIVSKTSMYNNYSHQIFFFFIYSNTSIHQGAPRIYV